MQQQESKELLLSVFGVAILIVAIAGITFAAFSYTAEGKRINYITTGSIKMSFVESNTNVITINNALPISDNVGMRQTSYFDFNILSTINGVMTVNYKVWVSKISIDNQLDDKYIKMYLEKEINGEYKSIVNPLNFNDISRNSMVLYEDKFVNQENIKKEFISKYRLRMWIDDTYELDEQSRNFKVKINVDGFM